MEKKEDKNSLSYPLFSRTHCPDIKRGCKFHHNTPICSQGGCLWYPDMWSTSLSKLSAFPQGWCGFISKTGVPKRYKYCSYFHPLNVKQIPPSPLQNSVMLITASNPLTTTPTVTGKNISPENNQNITEGPKKKEQAGAELCQAHSSVKPEEAFFSEKKIK